MQIGERVFLIISETERHTATQSTHRSPIHFGSDKLCSIGAILAIYGICQSHLNVMRDDVYSNIWCENWASEILTSESLHFFEEKFGLKFGFAGSQVGLFGCDCVDANCTNCRSYQDVTAVCVAHNRFRFVCNWYALQNRKFRKRIRLSLWSVARIICDLSDSNSLCFHSTDDAEMQTATKCTIATLTTSICVILTRFAIWEPTR